MLHFSYEAAVLILSWINIYISQFKIYEAFRKIVLSDENISSRKQLNMPFLQEEEEDIDAELTGDHP